MAEESTQLEAVLYRLLVRAGLNVGKQRLGCQDFWPTVSLCSVPRRRRRRSGSSDTRDAGVALVTDGSALGYTTTPPVSKYTITKTDVPVLQFSIKLPVTTDEQIELVRLAPREGIVEVRQAVPQERAHERVAEQTVAFRVFPIKEEIAKVVQTPPQEHVQE